MPVKSYIDAYNEWVHPTLTIDGKTLDNIASAAEKLLSDQTCKSKQTCKCKKSGKKSLPGIKHIQFNDKSGHTAIIWDDGTTTVVRCGDGESFERYVGFCAAVCKKLFGSTSAVKKMIDDKDVDTAKKRREAERLKKAEEHRKLEAENRERKKRRRDAELREAFEFLQKEMPMPDLTKLIDGLLGAPEGDSRDKS